MNNQPQAEERRFAGGDPGDAPYSPPRLWGTSCVVAGQDERDRRAPRPSGQDGSWLKATRVSRGS
jgi:hypothetical protein